jgi:Ser/Thr protein kinase RdoA (MazF antagonist)
MNIHTTLLKELSGEIPKRIKTKIASTVFICQKNRNQVKDSRLKAFNELTYVGQVRRLKGLAKVALRSYPIEVASIQFINHGENATFQVCATSGQKFLLRIHRDDYHSKAAIEEELQWLSRLAHTSDLRSPRPFRSKRGQIMEQIKSDAFPEGRIVCVFVWMKGRFLEKSITTKHLFELGRLIGRLQNNTRKVQVRHRRYWSIDGLVGTNPKFGSIENLPGVSASKQATLSKARRLIHRRLKVFEKKFPRKMGLIHADLHFGNLIFHQRQIAAIDFDDCGHGFYVYDLAVSLMAAEGAIGKKRWKKNPDFEQALIRGYASIMPWTKEDEKILPHFKAARRLAMIGWLRSRSDNPKLKSYLKRSVSRNVKYFNETYGIS